MHILWTIAVEIFFCRFQFLRTQGERKCYQHRCWWCSLWTRWEEAGKFKSDSHLQGGPIATGCLKPFISVDVWVLPAPVAAASTSPSQWGSPPPLCLPVSSLMDVATGCRESSSSTGADVCLHHTVALPSLPLSLPACVWGRSFLHGSCWWRLNHLTYLQGENEGRQCASQAGMSS